MSAMSAIYDPLSRIDAAPSRHAIESDSEDSDEDLYNDISESELPEISERFSIETSSSLESAKGKPLMVAIGQAGEGIASTLRWQEQSRITWRGRQQGSLSVSSQTTICLLYPSSILSTRLDDLQASIESLLTSLQPSR